MAEGVKRIAREQLEGAVESLKGKSKRDERVHNARKHLKKVRALLRLVKAELGDVYVLENTQLREAGRALSDLRDRAAVIQTFDELLEKHGSDSGQGSLDSIRRGLLLHKSRFERKAHVNDVLTKIAESLGDIASRAEKWPLSKDGCAAIAPGLERAFRRARNAMRRARKHPRSDTYHAWRKRAKDHWYHVRLLEDVWNEAMAKSEKNLKQLEDWLGIDHNLVVLRDEVRAEPDFFGPPEKIQTLLRLIAVREKELRENALTMGERIYRESSDQFRRRAERLWQLKTRRGREIGGLQLPANGSFSPAPALVTRDQSS